MSTSFIIGILVLIVFLTLSAVGIVYSLYNDSKNNTSDE